MQNKELIPLNTRFSRLVVIEAFPNSKYMVKVRCDCGQEKSVNKFKLLTSHTRSCGCLQREKATQSLPPATHGQSRHDGSRSSEYGIWVTIKGRCYNPKCTGYIHYGGRGIRMSKKWFDKFENFYNDMGPRPDKYHSIDRIDVDGNYSKENCKWSDWKEQANNRRNNKFVVIDGERMNSSDASAKLGISLGKISYLVRRTKLDRQFIVDKLIKNPSSIVSDFK